MARLLKICPGVRTQRETEERDYPAIEFHLGGLRVLASQTAESLSVDDVADTWEITGTNGVLPMGQSLSASWATLRAAYGTAVALTMTDNVTVMFCKFPGMFLNLDAKLATVGAVGNEEDQAKIPTNSKIVRVIIRSGPILGWRCVAARG